MKITMVFRIESPNGGSLWYDDKGNKTNIVKSIVDDYSLLKNMEMNFNPIYKTDGYNWLSTTKGIKGLKSWFSRKDLTALLSNDFKIYRIYAVECIDIENEETIIRKDKIVKKVLLNPNRLITKLYGR